jgi:hypothetical protein
MALIVIVLLNNQLRKPDAKCHLASFLFKYNFKCTRCPYLKQPKEHTSRNYEFILCE